MSNSAIEIKRQIIKSILSSPDAPKVPSVRELADRFSASTRTIHKVIRELQRDDIIESKGRNGSFVKPLSKRGSRSKKVAILSTYDIDINALSQNRYPDDVLASVKAEFKENGYEVEYFSVSNLDVLTLRTKLSKMKFSGFVLLEIYNPLLITELRELFVPMVSMDYNVCYFGISSVYFSNSWGAYEGTKHLIKSGHKNICLFNHKYSRNVAQSPFFDPIDEERIHGYLIAMKDEKLTPFVVEAEGLTVTSIKNELMRVLASNPKPTAFLFIKNYIPEFAFKELIKLGYKVPEDISVLSVDSVSIKYEKKEISYVWVDSAGMGKRAAEILISEIKHQAIPPQRVELPTRLILKESIRKI